LEEAAECVLHSFSHLFEDSFFSIAIRKGVGDGLSNNQQDYGSYISRSNADGERRQAWKS
jgi:hypothetical protein